jgi:hypothetical protein
MVSAPTKHSNISQIHQGPRTIFRRQHQALWHPTFDRAFSNMVLSECPILVYLPNPDPDTLL